MKKHLLRASSLSALLLLGATAAQAELGITPRVNLGMMNYSYKLTLNSGTWHKAVDTVGILGIGATMAFDRFFVDVYAQQSADGEDTYNYDLDIPHVFNNDMEFDREDYAIAVGYAVTQNLSFFGGYKWGTTNFTEGFNPAQASPGNQYVQRFETEFEENGPFIGAALGWPVGKGLISLNIAVAMLDADNQQILTEEDGIPRNQEFVTFTGDSTGVNIGISWRAPITDNLSYSLSMDGYHYAFDVDNASFPGVGSGSPDDLGITVQAKEDAFAVKAGIAYRF